MRHRLLLVDDDKLHLESAQEFLQNRGFLVDTAMTGDEAIGLVQRAPQSYSLVILDYRLKGRDGASTAEALSAINPDLYTLIFSGDTSRDAVLQATRRGARGFVDKAEGSAVFLEEVTKWCRKFEQTHLTLAALPPTSERTAKISALGMVGRSEALFRIAETVEALRSRKGSVLILGESGTGKELVARALAAEGQFRAVNCGAFAANPQLMSSTLFGHRKGAFTGAHADTKGVFEDSRGGTVFLDEIYALPVASQVELLRVVQEKAIVPVGGTREIPVDFRLIAAAKPQLLEAVEKETFQLDLFYRISRTVITLPPLRDRREDIAPLVHYFCERWSQENGETKSFLVRTLPYLENYDWPGNVRELENVVYSLLDLTPEPKIAPHHLDPKFFGPAASDRVEVSLGFALREKLNTVEKEHLVSVLRESQSLRDASRKMRVSLTTVLRLLKKHDLDGEALVGGGTVNRLRSLRNRHEP